MTTQKTFTANVDTFRDLGRKAAEHSAIHEARRGENETIAEEKMELYAALASDLLDVNMNKGNLPKYVREPFQAAMAEIAGLDPKKGAGKRYYDGSVGIARYAKRLGIDMSRNDRRQAIRDALAAQNIANESQLHKWIKGDDETSYIDTVVRRFVGGFSYSKDAKGDRYISGWRVGGDREELDSLIEALEAARRIEEQVQQATSRAEAEERKFAEVWAEVQATLDAE